MRGGPEGGEGPRLLGGEEDPRGLTPALRPWTPADGLGCHDPPVASGGLGPVL